MKYDNSTSPRTDYFKEIEHRLDALVHNAYENRVSDPESSMNNARKAAEAICRCTILKHQLTKPDNVPRELDAMLTLLRKNTQAMPRNILLHTETLQKWGNRGSHFETTLLTPDDISSALYALKSVVEWFYEENDLTAEFPHPTDEAEITPPKRPVRPARPARPVTIRRTRFTERILEPVMKDEDEDEDDLSWIDDIDLSPAEDDDDSSEVIESGRKVTNNFYIDLSLTKDHGSLTFRSPEAFSLSKPVYAAVKNSYYFDLDELFNAIRNVIAVLLELDSEDIVIHCKTPGEWQHCAPEIIYDYEDFDDTAINFDISYHKSTKNKRTEGFSLHAMTYDLLDDHLSLQFTKKPPLVFDPESKRHLSYYGLKNPAFLETARTLLRLLHPAHYVEIDPALKLGVDADEYDYVFLSSLPPSINLPYKLSKAANRPDDPLCIDVRLRDVMYERDDANANLNDVTARDDKLAKCFAIILTLTLFFAIAVNVFDGSDLLIPMLSYLYPCVIGIIILITLFRL